MKTTILVLLILVATSLRAQTVSPISQEFGRGKARGSFTLTNNQLSPLVVTFTVVQVEYQGGKQILHPLQANITAKLSVQSMKIPIKESRDVDFDVLCPSGCVTEIISHMTAASLHTDNGIIIMMHLPTLQYVCSGTSKDCRKNFLDAGNFHPPLPTLPTTP